MTVISSADHGSGPSGSPVDRDITHSATTRPFPRAPTRYTVADGLPTTRGAPSHLECGNHHKKRSEERVLLEVLTYNRGMNRRRA
jgi:hypothetical protein